MDEKIVIAELDNMSRYFNKMAKSTIGNGKTVMEKWANIARDAVNLLEEKAYVLTRQDANKWEGYVWVEAKDSNILGLKLISFRTVYEQYEEPIAIDKLNWDLYGKTWRLWSAMPTKIDRKEAKWND